MCVKVANEQINRGRKNVSFVSDERKWIAMWGKHMKSIFYCGMNMYQKVNHFPGSFHLGRKDKLHINISRLRKNSPILLDFVPQTFLLPIESKSFHKAWKKEGSVHRWIAKPVRFLFFIRTYMILCIRARVEFHSAQTLLLLSH